MAPLTPVLLLLLLSVQPFLAPMRMAMMDERRQRRRKRSLFFPPGPAAAGEAAAAGAPGTFWWDLLGLVWISLPLWNRSHGKTLTSPKKKREHYKRLKVGWEEVGQKEMKDFPVVMLPTLLLQPFLTKLCFCLCLTISRATSSATSFSRS